MKSSSSSTTGRATSAPPSARSSAPAPTVDAHRATSAGAGRPTGSSCRASGRTRRAWAGCAPVDGARIIGRRLAGGRPVLGICVGMQVLFERGVEHGVRPRAATSGRASVERLQAPVVPHMGWNTVDVARGHRALRRRRGRAVLLRALLRRPPLGPGDPQPHPGAAGAPGPSTAATGSSPPSRTARCGDPVPPGEVRRRRRAACCATGWQSL